MKKVWILSLFMAVMCVFMMPAAKADAKEKEFYYTDQSRKNYKNEEVIVIGKEADFTSCHTNDCYSKVKEIRFEEGITELDRYVFYYFPNVTKVTFPMSLADVEGALASVEGNLITDYKECLTKLEQFEVDSGNIYFMSIDGVLYSKDQKGLIRYPAGKKDEVYKMPEFVTEVDIDAFGTNVNLKEIKFGTRYIWEQFYNSSYYRLLPNLCRFSAANDNMYLTAKDGVLYDADMKTLLAYPRGKKVKQYVIPKTVTDIIDGAFEGAVIDTLVLPPSLSFCDYSSDSRFRKNQILAFSITDGTYLATQDGVVYNKDKTQLAIWPGRKKVSTLSFPSTLKSLNLTLDYIPLDCLNNVTKLIVPRDATFMFYEGDLTALKTIVVEKGNKDFALFDGQLYTKDLKTLQMITVKANKSTLQIPKAYQYSWLQPGNATMPSVKKIIVNGTGVDFPYELFPNLKEFALGKGNKKAAVVSGVLYSANKKTLIWYPQAKTGKSFTVPSTVTAFSGNAFAVQNYLETITLSKKLKLTSEDNRLCFANCKKLKQIKVQSGNAYLTAVNGVLYSKDKSVIFCYPAAKTSKSFTVPDSVKYFIVNKNAYLTSLTLGKKFVNFDYQDYDLNGLSGFTKLEKIQVSSKNTEYKAIQGVLYGRDQFGENQYGLMMVVYPVGKKDATFTIPEGVFDIFFECSINWKNHKYLKVLKSDCDNIAIYGKSVVIDYPEGY